jgi:predicted nuclease of restriction endonuclease-like (RecB) superfamily
MLYERTALSRKPEELARKELASLKRSGEVGAALVLKDPYILDFLDLQDHYMERDFEDAILRELARICSPYRARSFCKTSRRMRSPTPQ